MGSKPTIRDVARKAEVSIATVSYVLNSNSEAISEQVKARVWAAVRALNYHRAAAAVSLARQQTRNIGVILYPVDSDLTNPFYSFVVQGVVREAMDRDYNLLFSYIESPYRDRRDLPKIVREANVVGVLFVGRVDTTMAHDIRSLGISVVGVDHPPNAEIPSIQIDNRGGGQLAARHLLDLGHTSLAFVGRVEGCWSVIERCDAFMATLGRTVDKHVVSCASLTFHEGYLRSRKLLMTSDHVTAVSCANDEVAAGVLRAVRELGRVVPRDVSVVGFDDIIMSNYTDPPLTTVGVAKERMGRRAAARLLEIIEGGGGEANEEVVPVQMVIRSSTAAPRAAKAADRTRPVVQGHRRKPSTAASRGNR